MEEETQPLLRTPFKERAASPGLWSQCCFSSCLPGLEHSLLVPGEDFDALRGTESSLSAPISHSTFQVSPATTLGGFGRFFPTSSPQTCTSEVFPAGRDAWKGHSHPSAAQAAPRAEPTSQKLLLCLEG